MRSGGRHCASWAASSPDTILRWYRELIAEKYDGSEQRKMGRPRTPNELQDLVTRMARENPGWGYTRIRDALGNLGYELARTTIRSILKEHGIDPAPERSKRTTWKAFLRASRSMSTPSPAISAAGKPATDAAAEWPSNRIAPSL